MVNYYYRINYNIAIIVITYIRYNTRAPGGARAHARGRSFLRLFGGVFWGGLFWLFTPFF